MTRIAIVGMACRYPDAASPDQLWENVLSGRRAFRRLPEERLRQADYWAPDPAVPDRCYARTAAVIEGYRFDRVAYRVAGSTYRSTDLTHWLALDIAAQALADAGFPDGAGLPRKRTGVVVGNSLTGEFSRANLLRLRWPYVRRTVAAALAEHGWDGEARSELLDALEQRFKRPFPPADEDTLAGALSNTIAGRICNHFDLQGGGYTVDGACASSLLSVATACASLADGEVDVAVAGGVDLSLDPLELVGFAKTGALATGEMRVYDRGCNGFWPGEGCGMVVLMRAPDAAAAGRRSYATVAGWGISSDGRGGITRPEVDGYRLALHRAYRRAGFDVASVGLFEGHGTGTAVGDATELRALSLARRAADPDAPAAAIGSVKALIGHTKAAAGVAGLMKAALAVHHEVLPPTAGCLEPHPELTGRRPALRVLRAAEPWPPALPVRAGVSAMGFGGIHTHLTVENPHPRRRRALSPRLRAVARCHADAELLLLDAADPDALRRRVDELAGFAARLSYAEIGDLAVTLHRQLHGQLYRAAVVATSPEDAVRQLVRVRELLGSGSRRVWDAAAGLFVGEASRTPRIGYLFPGQGSGTGTSGGALRRRFAEADGVYTRAALPTGGDPVATAAAQPRIVTGTLAGLRVLDALGVGAVAAVGHSLGEISALHWAGSMDEATVRRVARIRGQTMATHSRPGTMASIAAGPDRAAGLLAGEQVVIAGYNGPDQTVVSGPAVAVDRVCHRAGEAGLGWSRLPVSHAFHSPLVAPAADGLARRLAGERFGPVGRRIHSTVTGEVLAPDADLIALLRRQIVAPVRFAAAVTAAAAEVDLFVEVGPGRVLSQLAAANTPVPAVWLDTDSESLAPLLATVGAAFVAGAPVDPHALAAGRPERPLEIGATLRFFASPCDAAPELGPVSEPGPGSEGPASDPGPGGELGLVSELEPAHPLATGDVVAATGNTEPERLTLGPGSARDSSQLVRELVTARVELPPESVGDDSRLLDDLHLSSVAVGQLLSRAARELGLAPVRTPTNFATATLKDLATALDELRESGPGGDRAGSSPPAGVASWVRPFRVDLVAAPLPAAPSSAGPLSAGPLSAGPVPARPLPAGPETEPDGAWQVSGPGDHPLVEPLRQALENGGVGSGVAVCLPPDCQEADLALALTAAQAAAAQDPGGRFLVVQHGRGAAGIAKTLRLEAPAIRTTIVDAPPVPETVARVLAEVRATTGFTEASYGPDGQRRVPRLRPLSPRAGEPPLGGGDVLLVTGGGKGITAECALSLASDTGARLAVLGRSDPARDPELAANLARMAETGATAAYARADVTDGAAVRSAVAELSAQLGPVTAVLHGAGHNRPAALSRLDMAAFRETLAPKLDGLHAVLDAVPPGALRLLVTFGSIIGRAGLPGEAHYATANDWLADATVVAARKHPHCRTVCLEWSVWSGVGMGERLSVAESLAREGVTPIPPDQGIDVLRRLLADPDPPPVVVVTGRTESIDTISYELPQLPLLRFVERPLVRYPGVELVADTELTAGTDPYLADHRLDGDLLFPAVIGLEAMAQAAVALTGWTRPPVIEQAALTRPIIVEPDGATTIRLAALRTGEDTVDVVIRSSETGFAADHFRGIIRSGTSATTAATVPVPGVAPAGLPAVPLDPDRELYGGLLFQGPRFRRLRRYRRAMARQAVAEVAAADSTWFAGFLPSRLVLADPGMHDAVMHGIQVCVPDATLLPAGIERIVAAGPAIAGPELVFSADERRHEGDSYVYDVAVRTHAGDLVERWDGLHLRAVGERDGRGPWVAPLLGPFLQRRIGDLLGVDVAVVVEPDHGSTRRAATALALSRAVGRPVSPRYRTDGRPEVDGYAVSAAHRAGLTVGVAVRAAALGALACDVETVLPRTPEEWSDLLGSHAGVADLVATERGEPAEVAATRVWSAIECLQKAGAPAASPLVLGRCDQPDWTVLTAGTLRIATFATTVHGVAEPVVFTVLAGAEGDR